MQCVTGLLRYVRKGVGGGRSNEESIVLFTVRPHSEYNYNRAILRADRTVSLPANALYTV